MKSEGLMLWQSECFVGLVDSDDTASWWNENKQKHRTADLIHEATIQRNLYYL